jgi:holin-like protein
MILALTLLLGFQLAGEVIARALGLTLPGPVLGMAFLLAAMIAAPRLAETVRAPAQGLLSHLSLLFVPAGVGVVGHLDLLGAEGGPMLLAIVLSTILAITAGALTFTAVARLMESRDD